MNSTRTFRALAGATFFVAALSVASVHADEAIEARLHALLDRADAPFVSLSTSDFMALGEDFVLPDGGRQVTALALAAPGGAFDPRDLEKLDPASLGYAAKWCVERYRHYNLDWDITGLRLTSLHPDAPKLPWIVIMNGGAANVYEFFVDLKNRPGWGQYLAQRVNVFIVTIPGNFKYGGWDDPIATRQPAYLLDRDLELAENEVRNCLLTNTNVMKGLKALLMNHTTGDLLLVGHSTSGEMAMLANNDPELRARTAGRYLGWGSGAPARLHLLRLARLGETPVAGGGGTGERVALHELSRRTGAGYGRTYSRWLNPLYEPGMSTAEIGDKWMEVEGRRRANFKQQIQSIEHGAGIHLKGWIEVSIEKLLAQSGNPWGIDLEEVASELFSTHYTRMDGYDRMVWTVAHYDRNHWTPENPAASREVYYADEYRRVNPDAAIRVMMWDPLMTHYGHVELPRQLAAATVSVMEWLARE